MPLHSHGHGFIQADGKFLRGFPDGGAVADRDNIAGYAVLNILSLSAFFRGDYRKAHDSCLLHDVGAAIPQGGMHQEPRRGEALLKFCAGNAAQPVDIGSGQGFQPFPEGSVARNEQLDMGKGRMRESLHQVGNALQLVNGSGKMWIVAKVVRFNSCCVLRLNPDFPPCTATGLSLPVKENVPSSL